MELSRRRRRVAQTITRKGKDLGDRVSKTSTTVSDRIKSSASSVRRGAKSKALSARDKTMDFVPRDRSKVLAGREYLNRVISSSTAIGSSTKQALTNRLGDAYESTVAKGASLRDQAIAFTQGILASDFSREMDGWLTKLFEGPATIYDKAMDAVYIDTHIGGGNHRLFDGGHSIWGAFKAGHDASPDDTIVQEGMGTVSAILKEVVTPNGLPIFTWSKETYDSVSSSLNQTFNIPKDWFYDLNTFTGVEVIGACIGTLAVALNWKRDDIEEFSKVVGSTGIASVLSANPLLAVVTIPALAKAFMDSKRKGDYTEFVEGLAKGGVGTGAFIATAVVVGGPAFVGIMAGVCTCVVINRATRRIGIVQVRDYVVDSMRSALGHNTPSPTPEFNLDPDSSDGST